VHMPIILERRALVKLPFETTVVTCFWCAMYRGVWVRGADGWEWA